MALLGVWLRLLLATALVAALWLLPAALMARGVSREDSVSDALWFSLLAAFVAAIPPAPFVLLMAALGPLAAARPALAWIGDHPLVLFFVGWPGVVCVSLFVIWRLVSGAWPSGSRGIIGVVVLGALATIALPELLD